MEPEYVTHTEFSVQLERINDENNRQNHRINELQNEVKVIRDLTVSVEKMAVNMGYMRDEISMVRQEIEVLKSIPASRWDKIVSGIIGAVITGIVGGIIAAVIHFT